MPHQHQVLPRGCSVLLAWHCSPLLCQVSDQAVSTLYPHMEKGLIFISKTPEMHLRNGKRFHYPNTWMLSKPDFNSTFIKTKIWQWNRCWNVLITGWWLSSGVPQTSCNLISLSVSVIHPHNLHYGCAAITNIEGRITLLWQYPKPFLLFATFSNHLSDLHSWNWDLHSKGHEPLAFELEDYSQVSQAGLVPSVVFSR